MRKILTLAAVIFASGLLFVYFWAWSDGRLGFDPEVTNYNWNSIARTLLALLGLLTGIVAGGFHRLWRERIDPLKFSDLKAAMSNPEIWRSLVAAPLVFTGVYTAAQAQPDIILSFFFAFQSGFFADAIVQGKAKAAAKPE